MSDLYEAAHAPPFKLLSSETKPLTRDLAIEMRQMTPSPTERDLRAARVEFLRERLLAGLFHPPHWVRAVVNGKMMRANGQHSSEMLSKCNGEFPEGLPIHIDTYECPDLDSLAALFRQFDDRRSARTPTDIAGAYQSLQPTLDEVPRHIGKLGVEGIAWWRAFVAEHDVPKGDDVYTIFNNVEEHAFLNRLVPIFNGASSEMTRPSVVAAVYATHRVDAEAATSFWHEVARGGKDYEESDPASVLSDWLKRARDPQSEIKPTRKQLYQGCIYAWNAMRDGKETLRDIRADIKKKLLIVK